DGQEVSCPVGLLTPGGTPAQIAVNGTVDPAITGATVANTATATTIGTETDRGDNASTFTSTITRRADLSITKTADGPPFVAGATARWTVHVTNDGPSAAPDVVVTDSIPPGVTLDEATTDDRCVLSPATGLRCEVGTVAVGAAVDIQVAGTVDGSLADGTSLTNTAEVASAAIDDDATDNRAAATVNGAH